MSLKLANNAVSKLASAILATDTSLALTPGDGAKFPALGAGDWFPVTAVKSDGTLEIMKCTAIAVDTLTVTRAQEGTAAMTFSAGDHVELRWTNAAYSDVSSRADAAQTAANAAQTTASAAAVKANNLSDLTDKAAARSNIGMGRTLVKSQTIAGAASIILTDADFGNADSITILLNGIVTTTGVYYRLMLALNPDGTGAPVSAFYNTVQYSYVLSDGTGNVTSSGERGVTFGRWCYSNNGGSTNASSELTIFNMQGINGLGPQTIGRCLAVDNSGNVLNGSFGAQVASNIGAIKYVSLSMDAGTISVARMMVYRNEG
jgi:hypothetical protein